MEPISLALGIIGLGTSLFGGLSQAHTAHEQAQVSSQIYGLEGQENAVRQHAMEMSSQRSQLETLRTTQRARAMAINAGASQTGSLQGSGVQGGIAETESQGAWGLQGINNQLSFGRQMFGLDSQISLKRMQLANLGGNMATDQGITSLGGALLNSSPALGRMASQGFGSLRNAFSLFSPGSLTGGQT